MRLLYFFRSGIILLLLMVLWKLTRPVKRSLSMDSWLITDSVTGLSIEGKEITVNLKNNQRVTAVARFKNKQGGPAAIQTGSASLENTNTTGAYTAEQDPVDELKVIIKGNPQSAGGDDDIGIVRLTVDADAGDGERPLVCELAVNVVPGDAEIAEFEVGAAEDQ